ncbi:MAG: hypothetical protein CM1200mP3_01860 [Chloroflexota bacterium]|nr:MAG: hypothetical protein CM1200mP3_01860 [Chloroflexota bacterium]
MENGAGIGCELNPELVEKVSMMVFSKKFYSYFTARKSYARCNIIFAPNNQTFDAN